MRCVLCLVLSLLAVAGPARATDWDAVQDLLETRCTYCHSGEFAPFGLQLDSHAGVVAGSENGAVLDIADPMASRLLGRVTGAVEPRMPLDGPPWLDEEEVALLRDWMAAGAAGPKTGPAPPPPEADPYADGQIVYSEIARVLARSCIECHSDNSRMEAPPEGLRLTALAEILAGGDRIVVIPGNPAASELIRRVEGKADPRMPLDGPPWLDEAQVALLRDWVAGGAMDDAFVPAPVPVGAEVRIRGVLSAADEIDGARFVVTPGTRLEDTLRAGDAAELRARVAADGTLVAERLRDR